MKPPRRQGTVIAIVSRDRGTQRGRGRGGRGRGRPREREAEGEAVGKPICGYTKQDDRCPGILTAGTD